MQTGNPYICATRRAKRKQGTCDDKPEKARLSILAFVEVGAFVFNPLTLVQDILTAEQGCKAIILRATAAEYDGGAETMGATGGRQKEKVVNRKHTINGIDYHYVGNEQSWMDLEANQDAYELYGFTEKRCWPFGGDLTIKGKGGISSDPELNVEGQYSIVYDKMEKPVSFEVDVKGLDAAPFLPFVSLTNGGTSAATISEETITTSVGAAISVAVLFTGATSYSVKMGHTLPAGLTFTAAGNLTGAATTAGTYTVTLRGESDCAVAGEVKVTIVVA